MSDWVQGLLRAGGECASESISGFAATRRKLGRRGSKALGHQAEVLLLQNVLRCKQSQRVYSWLEIITCVLMLSSVCTLETNTSL